MLPKSVLLVAVALAFPTSAAALSRPGSPGGAQAKAKSSQSASPKAQTIVAAAESAVGSPYVSGGTDPSGFDCSGLTTWAFKRAGIRLPRTSFDQYQVGRAVQPSDIKPGDLVFWSTDGPGASHVGIAVAANRAISATSSGGVMEHGIKGAGYWGSAFVGARRKA